MTFTRKWRFLLVLVGLTLLIAACSGSPPSAAGPADTPAAAAEAEVEAPATASVVRIGWNGSPDTLNPGTAVLSEAYTLFELVYDAMYDLQLDGSFTLSLAESVAISEDGTVWTFKIRDGIKFHDGEPLTAEDIVFSYNFYQSHQDFPYLNSYTGYFAGVEAPDDSTVVITLSEPIPNMESQLVFLYVLPKHIWSQYSEGSAGAEFENPEMIGSGPFKLEEYQQNEFVRLSANKEHFLEPPKVDEVVFQTFANPDALVQAIVTGQVDMITEMPNTAAPTLRNNADIGLVTGAPFSPEVRDIIFNQTALENCPPDDGKCTGHPALLDRNVRLALAHAADKQKIIDVALLGLGTPGLTLIPDGLGLWYNDTLQDYAFDLAKANQILDDAGYKDTNGDGVRDMPDGSRPLTFRLYWPNDVAEGPRIAELLGESWSQVGVKLEPQAFDPDALTTACCPAFDFDIIIWGWGSDPDPNLLLSVMTTEEIPSGSSETGYSNPEYDALYAQQATELDKDKRKELVWQMQQIVHDDVVYIIPYYAQEVQAYRKDRFTGWLTNAPKLALEDVTSLTVITPVQ
jgi:peptide/nickel transport system substrate-binding protein